MTIQTTEIKEYESSNHSEEGFTDCAIWFKCSCGEEITLSDYESEFCKACKRFYYYEKNKVFCEDAREEIAK